MGTYGEIVRPFEGFTLLLDTSVGSLSDHDEEAPRLARNEADARRFLARRRPQLDHLGRHFCRGPHAYRRLLAHLLPKRPPGLRGPAVELALPADEAPAPPPAPQGLQIPAPNDPHRVDASIVVHAAPGLPEAQRHKLAADLAWAQLDPGGLFERPAPGPSTRRTPLEVEELLGALLFQSLSVAPQRSALRLVAALRANQDALLAIAERPDPIPPEQVWSLTCARCGWFLARALRCVLARAPYDAAVWDAFATLPPAEAAQAARLLALLLPDRLFDAGLAALRAHATSDDPELNTWLAALA